jgi:hypothetical protein
MQNLLFRMVWPGGGAPENRGPDKKKILRLLIKKDAG